MSYIYKTKGTCSTQIELDLDGDVVHKDVYKRQVYAIRELGKEYASDIKLYVGFEAEYIPEFFKEQMCIRDRAGYTYVVDFVVRQLHLLGKNH